MIDTEALLALTGIGEKSQTRLTDPTLLCLSLGLIGLHVA